MSENNLSDNYEIGYGKPPRDNQFRKGVSGNPKGRPKKPLDFDDDLLRESRRPIIINEHGRRRRISKHEAVIKQLTNQAMKGDRFAARTYLEYRKVASDKAALLEEAQASELARRKNVKELSREELMQIVTDAKERVEQEEKRRIPILPPAPEP